MTNATLEKSFEYFLKSSFSNYADGEWVAIHGSTIISHGKKLKDVVSDVEKTMSLSKVLISKIKKTASYL